MKKETKHKLRRAGVTALGVGVGAAGGYLASKGLGLDQSSAHGTIPSDLTMLGGAMGGLGTAMGLDKIKRHSALNNRQKWGN